MEDFFGCLLLVYILYVLMSYVISSEKLLSPSMVFASSFTFMLMLAYGFKNILGFSVNELTFQVLALGGFIFIATECCVKLFLSSRKKCNEIALSCSSSIPIIISDRVICFFMVYIFIAMILTIYVFCINTGGESFALRMMQYRINVLYHSDQIEGIFFVSQLYKINKCVAYFVAYIFIYNWGVCGIKLKTQFKYVIIMMLFCVSSVFSNAARQPIIEIILFLPLVYFSLSRCDLRKKINFKKIIVGVVLLGIAFYYSSSSVGRPETQRWLLEYIAVYFCGGLYSFNLHIFEPARNAYWGQATFSDIYNTLIKWGLVSEDADAHYHAFDLYGNTVTLFGRWYEDFGQIGVYIMSFLVSLFFSILFYKKIMVKTDSLKAYHFDRFIYCKCIIALAWAGYDDRVRALLSMDMAVFVVVTMVLWKIFVVQK